ncbi:MAG: metallophosphoesterase [Gammaproteobacteria bacterium]|nr:metallophosphoesterase [Gammaproteobacteria bacterium]
MLPLLLLVLLPIHDGPDPIGSWRLSKADFKDGKLTAILGPSGRLSGDLKFVKDAESESLYFDGTTTEVVLADDYSKLKLKMPKRHMTIDAWVAVNTPTRWGSFLCVAQDNGESERGWILGYNSEQFSFGLASEGADDGDGKMTFLVSKTKYEEGRFYHVAATYDGEMQCLYVNGKLEASSKIQSGDILYPKSAPFVLGGYRDVNEFNPLHGRIHSVRLFGQTAKAKTISHSFQHGSKLTRQKPHIILDPNHRFVVNPYLQWATKTGMTICWETSRPSSSLVQFDDHVTFVGEKKSKRPAFGKASEVKDRAKMHQVRLNNLKANTAYYYRVLSIDDLGRKIQSGVLSFQTAPDDQTPFAFAVMSDTQGNPKVSGVLAKHAWGLRPNFVLHPGDLVETGTKKEQWVGQFFSSMKPLLERVALFPVLGNHEYDARFYYDYMALPDPEYYYTFNYGNAQFFMLDTNRDVSPSSVQYRFLAKELAKSKAEWKIVCYHHPAYSSDENDYGNTWYGPSTKGDLRVRSLVELIDKYKVDIVWNGHIHSYERTWPLRSNKATAPDKGTLYMVTGGGGGPLEMAGPIRPYFQNTVKHGHHFCYVAVNGKTLEIKSFDLEGRLFDMLKIEKN